MNHPIPTSIGEYLRQLRAELRDADPALVQDALYDAEEHLRAELAEHPELDEATVLARLVGSYGAPEEVAEIYRVQEGEVERALRPPRRHPQRGVLARFFGVAADPRAYAALFYMLLALATGTFYFTWAVTGLSLSLGLSILIIGLPFIVLFFGSVRLLSFVEGKIVEAMLGVRMPRRPPYTDREQPFLTRIGAMFTDPRSWSTLLYMLLMLPLGVLYFTLAVTVGAFALAFVVAPVLQLLDGHAGIDLGGMDFTLPLWTTPLQFAFGVLLLFGTLHLARGIGHLHGHVAKSLLVKA